MTAQEVVAQVYRPGVTTAELVSECLLMADEGALREAAEIGFADLITHREAGSWKEINGDGPSVRSGHKNSSGIFTGLKHLPRGVDILSIGVRLNDGTALLLGEMDRDMLRRWHEEFLIRVRGNQTGAEFSQRLLSELEESKKKYVRQLGAERVAAIRKETGFRTKQPSRKKAA